MGEKLIYTAMMAYYVFSIAFVKSNSTIYPETNTQNKKITAARNSMARLVGYFHAMIGSR